MTWALADAAPVITLTSALLGQSQTWTAERSLLESSGSATDFVVEFDDWGNSHIRFGDNEHGAAPPTGAAFTATYRVGNGSSGNVGAETIAHIVASPSDLASVTAVRNPLAAAGGVDPESNDSVRRNAPQAFRVQERAVTPADYAWVTEMEAGVRRAASVSRWTGSWHTMFTAIAPQDGVDASSLVTPLERFVDGYRMMGVDLEFDAPTYVSLEIEIHICVADGYFRADVEAALLNVFSNQRNADGSVGLFDPDNFDFGQTVYLSPIYAAAHSVAGVASAQVTTFQRQGTPDPAPLAQGEMRLAADEIAQLDNDPNFPEHGVLRLDLNGGN
jgi:predicted phage baseplate assembly protein